MKVRVYQPAGDAPVRVVIPNERMRERGEDDGDFLNRICAITEAADPTLVGLPFVDMDHAALPARERIVDGRRETMRPAWRMQGGVVTVKEDRVIKESASR